MLHYVFNVNVNLNVNVNVNVDVDFCYGGFVKVSYRLCHIILRSAEAQRQCWASCVDADDQEMLTRFASSLLGIGMAATSADSCPELQGLGLRVQPAHRRVQVLVVKKCNQGFT